VTGLELSGLLLNAFGRPALDVVLELHPIPSPRPRFAGKPFPKVYMPAPYMKHKAAARALLMRAGLMEAVRGPVRLHVLARVAVPTSFPEWKKRLAERGELWPQQGKGKSGGDADNYLKTAMDFMSPKTRGAPEAGVWADDGGVRVASAEVLYARPDVQGGRPYWRVLCWQLPGRLAGAATTKAGEVIGG
jgi:Holliday junction resolvase RusA-like endonuclease